MDLASLGYYDDWDAVLALKNNATFDAETRDAVYGIPIDTLLINNASIFGVMMGVLHKNVINVTYNSVGVDIVTELLFVTGAKETNWWYDNQLQGSASRYLTPEILTSLSRTTSKRKDTANWFNYITSNIDNLFAIDYFEPGGCATSSTPQWCFEYNASNVANTNIGIQKTYLEIGERIYGVSATQVGPYANGTIPSQFISFVLNKASSSSSK